jgi:hypothetical protein
MIKEPRFAIPVVTINGTMDAPPVKSMMTMKPKMIKKGSNMKIRKSKFRIKKIESGYGIFLRTMQERPIDRYPTKRAAKKRLNEYIRKVNQ